MRHAVPTCLALLLVLAAPGMAQGNGDAKPADAKPAADTTPPPPIAIPVSDIPARAQEAEARLEEIKQLIPRDPGVAQVAAAYTAAQDTVKELLEQQARPGPERRTKRSLTDLHNEWIRRIAQMREWQKITGSRITGLGAVQSELDRRSTTWELTLAGARAEKEAAPAVLELAAGILATTNELEDSITARVGTVLRLQSQIARTIATIQRADEQVNEQLASLRRNLLRLDNPPLWRGLGPSEDAQGFWPTVRAGAEQTWAEVVYFVEVYRLQVYFHLASMLGILFAVSWFRGKLERHTAEQPAASARRVLDHPVAGSVLIIALAALYVYPRAPLAIYDLALLLTIPALLYLLPALLPPEVRRAAVAGSILFAVQRIGGLVLSGSPYQRAGSLVISLVAAAGLLWLGRHGGELRRLGADSYGPAARVIARIAAAVFLAAEVSNVVGNVSLALFLSGGMLASAYILLVILAAFRIISGILIVATRSEAAATSRYVAQRKDALVATGLKLLRFLAVASWLAITLWLFDSLDPLIAAVRTALAASLSIGELRLSLGAALLFVTTLWVSLWISRALSSLLEVDVLSRLDMPRGLPNVIGRLTRYALIAMGFLFALAAIGLELTQLTIIGGALGVGIGFGLQNVVSNFVSGLILAFERPIREGDLIQLDTLMGEVRRIGFRASIIRTFEGAEVIVPNASLISKEVINWTLSDQQRRIAVEVGVAYGTDPDAVLALLLRIPDAFPTVLKEPAPMALFTGFGDSALNFELRVWTVDVTQVAVLRSAVTVAVNNALNAAGIEIPFPQRDLHLRSVDAGAAGSLQPRTLRPEESR